MPWKVSSVMDERRRFVARLREGDPMPDVCREFGISRKTGYKIYGRYKLQRARAQGPDRPRAAAGALRQLDAVPDREPDRLAQARQAALGAREIRELLVRRLAGEVRVPAKSTIHAVLDRHGLVKRIGRTRSRARGTPLLPGAAPNDLWCAAFKGEFKLGAADTAIP